MKDYGDISSLVPEVERFEALDAIPSVKHSFLLRAPGIDVCMDRQAALVNLRQYYRSGISGLGYGLEDTAAAEQVHGKAVERVERVLGFDAPVADADALVTDRPGILLAILVADCCAVFLADKKGSGVALVHSGRKGSGMGIVTRA